MRYPDVPRPIGGGHGGATNLFGLRLSIAAFGSVLALVIGTIVIRGKPSRASVRILIFGIPIVAIIAAIAMPVVTLCPAPGIGHGGYCTGYLFMHIVRAPTSLEITARLTIAALGCGGGLYFWILAKRTGVESERAGPLWTRPIDRGGGVI